MPLHVFVETNWVVDYAAPAHWRGPAAQGLVDKAAAGEIVLHVPAICLREGENTIRKKFQPKEAKALQEFRRWAREHNVIDDATSTAATQFLQSFISSVQADLAGLDAYLAAIPTKPNVDVFALTEPMLRRAISLRTEVADFLKPFDEAILAAVLVRAGALIASGIDHCRFCELDGDLLPWDKHGSPRQDLQEIYDDARVWVHGDYDLTGAPAWPPD